jgi:hypothetical protein
VLLRCFSESVLWAEGPLLRRFNLTTTTLQILNNKHMWADLKQ